MWRLFRSFMVEIVKRAKDYVVIYKPPGIPSQSDKSGDKDALTFAAELLRAAGESDRLWLVHRLDRTVGGLMVLARTKFAAQELSRQVCEGKMTKRYLAVAEGEVDGGVYRDYIFKDSARGKAFIVDSQRKGVKAAELVASPLGAVTAGGVRTLVDIELVTGRFHQIRAQLSHRHTPLVGDGKYGARDHGISTPALFAYKLCFNIGKERVTVKKMPSTEIYPWSCFTKLIEEMNDNE